MAVFHLSKWYLDCVTGSGNASIAYVGDLSWGPAHLHYSSLLRSVGNSVTQHNSLRRPSLDDVFLKLTGHAIREEAGTNLDRMRMMGRMFGGGGRR